MIAGESFSHFPIVKSSPSYYCLFGYARSFGIQPEANGELFGCIALRVSSKLRCRGNSPCDHAAKHLMRDDEYKTKKERASGPLIE